MFRLLNALLLLGLLSIQAVNGQVKTDRERDGWKGPVKSVRVERAEISSMDGQSIESPRILQSVTNYDESGRKIEELSYDYKGSLDERIVFSRDDKGNQIKTIYKPDGTIASKWVYTFDERGRMTGGTQYTPDGAVRLKMERVFDASGKLIEASIHKPDGSLMNKTLFKYDAEGRPTSQAVYSDTNELLQKSVWSETGNTNMLFDMDGAVSYKSVARPPSLEFDSYGNCIKRTTQETETRMNKSKEIIKVIYMTISYY